MKQGDGTWAYSDEATPFSFDRPSCDPFGVAAASTLASPCGRDDGDLCVAGSRPRSLTDPTPLVWHCRTDASHGRTQIQTYSGFAKHEPALDWLDLDAEAPQELWRFGPY